MLAQVPALVAASVLVSDSGWLSALASAA